MPENSPFARALKERARAEAAEQRGEHFLKQLKQLEKEFHEVCNEVWEERHKLAEVEGERESQRDRAWRRCPNCGLQFASHPDAAVPCPECGAGRGNHGRAVDTDAPSKTCERCRGTGRGSYSTIEEYDEGLPPPPCPACKGKA